MVLPKITQMAVGSAWASSEAVLQNEIGGPKEISERPSDPGGPPPLTLTFVQVSILRCLGVIIPQWTASPQVRRRSSQITPQHPPEELLPGWTAARQGGAVRDLLVKAVQEADSPRG
jgi:hypothetical protein